MNSPSDWRDTVRQHLGCGHDPALQTLVDEIADHLQELVREAVASGQPRETARASALAALAAVNEHTARAFLGRRHAPRALGPPPVPPSQRSPLSMLTGVWRDVTYGVRSLARVPTLTCAAIATLALGIGPTTAVYSLLQATLFARLPVADSARLVHVGNGPSPTAVFSYPGYAALRDRSDVFDALIAFGGITASLNALDTTDTVNGVIVSGNYFEALGVRAALGRTLTTQDDVTPGAHPVAVVSHGLWQRRFAGRADVVGQPLVLNGHTFTVVGVTPREFHGAQLGVIRDLYVPLMMQAVMRPPRAGYSGEMNPDLLRVATNQWLFAIGRLKSGVSADTAGASLSALQLALDPPDRPRPANSNERITLASVDSGPPEQRRQLVSAATLLTAVVIAVLLIACANTANLLLSRAAARQREVSVRMAIGAGRGRIVRQLLVESALLAAAGGLAGVAVAFALLQVGRAWAPPAGALPLQIDATLDLRVLAFALLLSLGTGLLFGLIPALQTARPDMVHTLRNDGSPADRSRRWLSVRNGLVVTQVGLSLALLIGGGLFARSLREAQRIDAGYTVDRLLRVELPINLLRYTREQGREFYQRAAERVAQIPGVEATALARVAPLTGAGRVTSLHVEGRTGSAAAFGSDNSGQAAISEDEAFGNVVSPGFFTTVGVPLQEGRDFDGNDREGAALATVVSRTFVTRHFANESALGKRISINGPTGPWRTVVGVVADAKYRSLNEAPAATVYVPLSQNHETGMSLYVRTHPQAQGVRGWVRREAQALDPNLALGEVRSMREEVGNSLYLPRVSTLLISALGALAMLLAAVGVYGVLAFAVARRTRELGIRAALGARARSLFSKVLLEGLSVVAVGVVVGLLLASASAGLIAGFLTGIAPADPLTYAGVTLLLLAVAAVACAVPAWRATRVDPLIALRQQ